MADSFYAVLTAAINDMVKNGFDSAERVAHWQEQLARAAAAEAMSQAELDKLLRDNLNAVYRRTVEKGGAMRWHRGIERFTIDKVRPKLRAELTRRIMASADLIKLNREEAISQTLRRFSGWATSIPAGGTDQADKRAEKLRIRKSLKSLPFTERRVLIDQGHKLVASINNIIATDGGAIAVIWHSHWREPGYDYRPDHKERDERVYTMRGNWAVERGLMKAGDAGYYDEITAVGEEPFCFPGDSRVPFARGVDRAFRRQYSGEMITITTQTGRTLRATPNHPVLTPTGWRAIGELNQGDEIVEVGQEHAHVLEKHSDHAVPSIAQIAGALQECGVVEALHGRRAQFHGDGAEGHVDVIDAARCLTVDLLCVDGAEGGKKFSFATAKIGGALRRTLGFGLNRLLRAAYSVVGGAGKALAAFGAFFRHADQRRLVAVTGANASNTQVSDDDTARHLVAIGEFFDAFASKMGLGDLGAVERYGVMCRAFDGVETDSIPVDAPPQSALLDADDAGDLRHTFPFATQAVKVVGIERERFAGHVYNLQTADGWYVTEGIITHNCRCFAQYIYNLRDLPTGMLTRKGRDELERVRVA